MLDDPLGLIVQGIAILAAGMYPIGLMLGSQCSPCCCPPARCTHRADWEVRYPNEGCRDGYRQGGTARFGWGVTADALPSATTFSDGQFEGPANNEAEYLRVPAGEFPDFSQELRDAVQQAWELSNVYNPEYPTAEIEPEFALLITSQEFWQDNIVECSRCPVCCPDLSLVVEFRYLSFFEPRVRVFFGWSSYGTLGECSQTEVAAVESSWTFLGIRVDSRPIEATNIVWYGGEIVVDATSLINDLQDWLDARPLQDLRITDIEPCECGACCEGGECVDAVVESNCTGDWLGADTTCEDDGPCPTGSCCDPNTGNCAITGPSGCDPENYTPGGSCDPNPCPEPLLGACCENPSGNCTQTTQANCSGTWIEGAECDPNPCERLLGACCEGGFCYEYTEEECLSFELGFTWQPGFCDPNPCE